MEASSNDCSWSVTSSDGWITLSGTSGKGSGGGTFAVAPNSGSPRRGFIALADQKAGISQYGFIACGQTRTGTVDDNKPVDVYDFSISESDLVIVSIETTTGDPVGTEVYARFRPRPYTNIALLSAGTYQIEVGIIYTFQTGGSASAGYRLSLKIIGENGCSGRAVAIDCGQSLHGTIDAQNDFYAYTFFANAGERARAVR